MTSKEARGALRLRAEELGTAALRSMLPAGVELAGPRAAIVDAIGDHVARLGTTAEALEEKITAAVLAHPKRARKSGAEGGAE